MNTSSLRNLSSFYFDHHPDVEEEEKKEYWCDECRMFVSETFTFKDDEEGDLDLCEQCLKYYKQ